MNTKQIRYVLALAQEGSFSKAADVLGITQPSLSQYIKKIEKEIGFQLFDRTNGDVRINDAGRIYLDAGRKILNVEQQMISSFSDLATHKTGSIVIGTVPYRAVGMMPAIASAFQKRYPGMHLVVHESTTDEISEGMEHGDYDLALTLLPIDGKLFQWEKVAEEEIVLATPASFPSLPSQNMKNRLFPAISPNVLNGRHMVMLTDYQFMQKQLNSLIAEYQLTVYTAAVVKSIEAQIEMVKAGVGIALVPSDAVRFSTSSELVFYSFRNSLPKREVAVIWRKDHKLPKVTEELIDLIKSISW